MIQKIYLTLILSGCLVIHVFTQNVGVTNPAVRNNPKFATINDWEAYMRNKTTSGEKVLPEEYAEAAKVSFSEKNFILSAVWFEEARTGNYSDAEMYAMLAAIYRELKDFTGETKTMGYYLQNFPDGTASGIFKERLFGFSVAEKNYEKILQSWIALNDTSRTKEGLLNAFFLIQKEKNMKESCDSLAKKILAVNPRHIAALEWLGEKYYWLGENLYLQSYKEYERNKTSLNYLKLTQNLEVVTADFNKALTFYETLWGINPTPRYASFMANIHSRFKNKQKTDYYKGFIK